MLNFDLFFEYVIVCIVVDLGKQIFFFVEYLYGKVFLVSDGSLVIVEDVVFMYDDYNKVMRDGKNYVKYYFEQIVIEGYYLFIVGMFFSDLDMRFWLFDVLQNLGDFWVMVLIVCESMFEVMLNQFMGMKKVFVV